MSAAKPTCAVCGKARQVADDETWFFVGGPDACKHLCSRECLVEFARRLQPRAITRLKHGSFNQILPKKA